MQKVFTFVLTFILLIQFAGSVLAAPPAFPQCSAPTGELIASYESGTHGIPGDTSSHEGEDKVYKISSEQVMQCFCASDGKGIQSNWWRVSSLQEVDINSLLSDGWHYISSGEEWGLDEASYLVKNSEYTCKENGGGGTGGSGSVSGSAASTSGSVLGLAATGSAVTTYAYLVIGSILTLIGTFIRRKV